MPRRLLAATSALLLVVSLAGCGDDDDDTTAAEPGTTEEPATTDGAEEPATDDDAATDDAVTDDDATDDDAATDDEDAAAEDTGVDEDVPEEAPAVQDEDPAAPDAPTGGFAATSAQLRDALLSVEDLPEGWTETTGADVADTPCGVDQELAGQAERMVRQFESPDQQASMVQHLLAGPTGGGAEVLAELGDLLADCTEEDGEFSVEFVEQDDAPELGDDARSFVGTVTGPDGETELPWVIVQQGDIVLGLAAIDLAGDGDELLDTYLEQALAQLDGAGIG
jgi:hypothetical protein